jgi:transposase
MPRPHPPEFRQRAVELARLREKPVAQIATDLGISDSCLGNWMAQADIDEGRREGRSRREREELVELRRVTRTLKLENEILKRAAAYFRSRECAPKMIYTFICRRWDGLPVAACCRVMGVSPSGFYAWRARLIDGGVRWGRCGSGSERFSCIGGRCRRRGGRRWPGVRIGSGSGRPSPVA